VGLDRYRVLGNCSPEGRKVRITDLQDGRELRHGQPGRRSWNPFLLKIHVITTESYMTGTVIHEVA
jgi:hypothetical protein